MEIKNARITFWFQKEPNPKIYVDKLNKTLNDYFFDFNILSVPANIEPTIPRLNAVSESNHSNIEISLINARLNTRFDEHYWNDLSLCINYLQERASKLFDALSNCNINILYSAITLNIEQQNNDSIEILKKHFLHLDSEKNISELGISLSQEIDNKFYEIINFNTIKQIKIEKQILNEGEIILPLLSLKDASEVHNFINISIEINDKLGFNLKENHKTKKDDFLKMFQILDKQTKKEISRF